MQSLQRFDFVEGNSRYYSSHDDVLHIANILSIIGMGLRGLVDNTVAFQSVGCGFASWWPHFLFSFSFFFFFFFFVFFIILFFIILTITARIQLLH